MHLLHRLGLVVWLALALVVGQQAALRHELVHAGESFKHPLDSKPAQGKCDKCFACAQLNGVASTVFTIPPVDCDVAGFADLHSGVPSEVALAYRSRAPPGFL